MSAEQRQWPKEAEDSVNKKGRKDEKRVKNTGGFIAGRSGMGTVQKKKVSSGKGISFVKSFCCAWLSGTQKSCRVRKPPITENGPSSSGSGAEASEHPCFSGKWNVRSCDCLMSLSWLRKSCPVLYIFMAEDFVSQMPDTSIKLLWITVSNPGAKWYLYITGLLTRLLFQRLLKTAARPALCMGSQQAAWN